MPSFIFKQQALKAGKSEFSQHTAREVTAAACEHESKHKLYSTSSPSNSHPYLTTKGMWHTQGEAEALGLQRCSFMLLSRARQTQAPGTRVSLFRSAKSCPSLSRHKAEMEL